MDRYTKLKRKIYLVIFPIIIVINVLYWLLSHEVDLFLSYAFLPFSLFLAIVWILIYFKRWIRACEMISLVVFGIYHLFRVHCMAVELEEGIINAYVLWSTMYFIYIFMVLERKRALAYALLIYLFTIIIGTPHFDDLKVNETLIQYYITTLIYILVLFYFQRIISAYKEADMLRKNAYFDPLTDIGNRRSIDMWLENETYLGVGEEKNLSSFPKVKALKRRSWLKDCAASSKIIPSNMSTISLPALGWLPSDQTICLKRSSNGLTGRCT